MNNDDQSDQPRQHRPAQPPAQGLYDPRFEHDACGVGFLVNINGTPSHAIIEQGIDILKNLLHRGATGADMNTGDGAGLLFQMPDRFLRKVCRAGKTALPGAGRYGAGMFFLPRPKLKFQQALTMIESVAQREGLPLLGRREVPVVPEVLGELARQEMPAIQQFFFDGGRLEGDTLERRLYILRKQIEKEAASANFTHNDLYICSLSARTIVYKGLMQATQVADFYPDLRDQDMESALAVVHQRYSTNTFPSWPLSQPFRYLAHNGEINTVRGNLNNMRCRENAMVSDVFGEDIKKILPVCESGVSDSANLDNGLELLTRAGRSIEHSMIMMIPQAWGQKYPIGQDLRGFFEYHAGLMEPWDGPAAVAFTDGRSIGAMLDRNGLRPARYAITRDGFMVFASEAGVLDLPPESVCEKGALRPGQMILVDLDKKRVLHDAEIKMALARRQPYRRWVQENRIDIHGFFNAVAPVGNDPATLLQRQYLFGYTREDQKIILGTMASTGQEPKGSMGSDQPLAVLSEKPQLLYWYFKQMFAQVTNPAIDPIREELVMSLMTFIGNPEQILLEIPQHARLIKLRHPVLSNEDLERIRSLPQSDFQSIILPASFPGGGSGAQLAKALDDLCERAGNAVGEGARVLIISDRKLPEDQAPVPMLLAVAAVNRHLVRKGLRTRVGIIAETGEAREVMHLALLLGYGATAVNPYLAFETISHLASQKMLDSNIGIAQAIENYTRALCGGLLKIMSKMGISTLRSYRSAQIFEAIGLNSAVVNAYFEGTPTRIEGLGLDEIAREANLRHETACQCASPHPAVLPRLKRWNRQTKSSSVSSTGAMSFGSISREAHETLAIAMNRMGAMSNSGEGGEDPARYRSRCPTATAAAV
jgi:glutamate synthase domain-containing protein 1